MHQSAGWAAWAEALLARHWWRADRTALATLLLLMSRLYAGLAAWQRRGSTAQRAPVPVIVVGNLVVGGAGKTPVVIALVQALVAAGYRPGVLSRGYGRRAAAPQQVRPQDDPADVGDEPLLIQRRTGAPLWVGRDRLQAARALCAQHAEVDVLVCDDGLQHHRLARDVELLVFDARGVGNGLLLPAGPLREQVPAQLTSKRRVLYAQGHVCTALPGTQIQRRLQQAWPLQAWFAGDSPQALPLAALQGRPLLAVAGVASPQGFFSMLIEAGLHIQTQALPDHSRYEALPWPADTPDVITTEKDAVKLRQAVGGFTRVWVVPLDLVLPSALLHDVMTLLPPAQTPLP